MRGGAPGLEYWLEAIDAAGLSVTGVYDRYGNWMTLRTPLLEEPPLEAWLDRIEDRRFENNFELYLAKSGSAPSAGAPAIAPRPNLPSRQFLKSPPRPGSPIPKPAAYPGSTAINLVAFPGRPVRPGGRDGGSLGRRLETLALQRLGRIGAFFRMISGARN